MTDSQFIELAEKACQKMDGKPPVIIEVPDKAAGFPASGRYQTYEDFVNAGSAVYELSLIHI